MIKLFSALTILAVTVAILTMSILIVPPKPASAASSVGNGCSGGANAQCLKNNSVVKYLNIIVDFLSASVGVIVIGVIIAGGIQYSLAGDNPQALTAARGRIVNGLIALVAYALIFAFLQWLIPGGVFNNS